MSRSRQTFNYLKRTTALTAAVLALMACTVATADERGDGDRDDAHGVHTATPIKHLIVLIGENRTFDNIYATYQARNGQSVANLLSRGIIHANGIPGPNYLRSMQFQINQPYPATYFIDALATAGKTPYQQSPGTPAFPVPNTAYVPTAPGGLSAGQAPFDPSQVPNSELPTLEPSFERAVGQCQRIGDARVVGEHR